VAGVVIGDEVPAVDRRGDVADCDAPPDVDGGNDGATDADPGSDIDGDGDGAGLRGVEGPGESVGAGRIRK
jgi:hypothetical protein